MTDNTTVEKEIYDNYILSYISGATGHLELDDDVIKLNHNHYVFIFTLSFVKVYFNTVLIASHFFDFGNKSPDIFENFRHHIFGGHNQGYPDLTTSRATKQYWQGSYADIRVFNSELNQNDMSLISIDGNSGFIQDGMVFANEIKLSSDFIVGANIELLLSIANTSELNNYARMSDYGSINF